MERCTNWTLGTIHGAFELCEGIVLNVLSYVGAPQLRYGIAFGTKAQYETEIFLVTMDSYRGWFVTFCFGWNTYNIIASLWHNVGSIFLVKSYLSLNKWDVNFYSNILAVGQRFFSHPLTSFTIVSWLHWLVDTVVVLPVFYLKKFKSKITFRINKHDSNEQHFVVLKLI